MRLVSVDLDCSADNLPVIYYSESGEPHISHNFSDPVTLVRMVSHNTNVDRQVY